MTTVLYLGMCFAALRSKNPEVGRSVVYNLTIALIAFTILAAFARRDRYRSTLAGAACFGCVYLFLELSHFVVELQTRSGTVVNCLLAILAGLIGAAWGLLFVRGQPAATAAPAPRGRRSLRSIGFTIFALAYLFASADEFIKGPTRRPRPVTQYMLQCIWALYRDYFYTDNLEPETFFIRGHLVLAVIVGIVGILMGDLFAGQRPAGPPSRDESAAGAENVVEVPSGKPA